ncbi:MAG: hypothetical protein PWR06_2044 [Thermoanaerobacteraceae bacterium]|nr:hypothetical protein [Thermoanaerobacteraceae bacterium]MDN5313046.1 hypothetical protein [Thermoanaerobacteraceae bacterium]
MLKAREILRLKHQEVGLSLRDKSVKPDPLKTH